MTKHPSAGAFTLLELLIVLGILATLFVLGTFAAKASMEKTNALECLNSMRAVGTATHLYVADNNGRLPDTGHSRAEDGTSLSWRNTLAAYFGTNFIERCPSSRSAMDVTYAWNDLLTDSSGVGISYLQCSTPASTLALAEIRATYNSEHFHFAAARSRVTYNQFKSSADTELHGNHANYLFVDGHVEKLSANEVKKLLNSSSSTFLKP